MLLFDCDGVVCACAVRETLVCVCGRRSIIVHRTSLCCAERERRLEIERSTIPLSVSSLSAVALFFSLSFKKTSARFDFNLRCSPWARFAVLAKRLQRASTHRRVATPRKRARDKKKLFFFFFSSSFFFGFSGFASSFQLTNQVQLQNGSHVHSCQGAPRSLAHASHTKREKQNSFFFLDEKEKN